MSFKNLIRTITTWKLETSTKNDLPGLQMSPEKRDEAVAPDKLTKSFGKKFTVKQIWGWEICWPCNPGSWPIKRLQEHTTL